MEKIKIKTPPRQRCHLVALVKLRSGAGSHRKSNKALRRKHKSDINKLAVE